MSTKEYSAMVDEYVAEAEAYIAEARSYCRTLQWSLWMIVAGGVYFVVTNWCWQF